MSLPQLRAMGASQTKASVAGATPTYSILSGYTIDACNNPNSTLPSWSSNLSSTFVTATTAAMDVNGGVFGGGIAVSADNTTIIGVRGDLGSGSIVVRNTNLTLSNFTSTTLSAIVSIPRLFCLNGIFILFYYGTSTAWGYYYSTDKGATWTNVTGSASVAWGSQNFQTYAGYVNGRYWFTLGNGTTWSTTNDPSTWGTAGTSVWSNSLLPANTTNVIYSGTTYIATTTASTTTIQAATTLGTWVTNTTGIGTSQQHMATAGSNILVMGDTTGKSVLITNVSGTTLTFGTPYQFTAGSYPSKTVLSDGTRFGLYLNNGSLVYSTNNATWTTNSNIPPSLWTNNGASISGLTGSTGSPN